MVVFSRKVLHVPNFCPECGSSQATSRFCSSCGYSLASTPAPPDARTRVEDTPVFRPFAPPVVETWDSLAADPWSSTAGAVIPPPVRNVVTQTPVDVSETKLAAVKWLWRIFLLATIAFGFAEARSSVNEPLFSTDTPIYFLIALAFVPLLTMAGMAASAARQVGAKTPHPALAVLLVVGYLAVAYVLAGLISPEYGANVEIESLYDKGLDRRILYGVALLVQSLAVYMVALAPVVALSKALGDRYCGDEVIPGKVVKKEPSSPGWASAWLIALSIGVYEIITVGLANSELDNFPWGAIFLFVFGGSQYLWRFLDFKTRSEIDAGRARRQSRLLEGPYISRGFVISLGLAVIVLVVFAIRQ
jgi:hypothetical protein